MYPLPVRRLSIITLTAALVWPAAAWAEKPTVLVLPYQALNKGVTPELAEQTTVVVVQELTAGSVSVQRADDVADAPAPSSAPKESKNAPSGDPAAGDQAQELIAAAKQAIDDQSPGPAIDKLKKAVKLLDANGDAVADIRIIGDAYLQLSIAYFLDGDEDAADEALTQAIHYVPTRELDDSEYPNLFIRVYNRVRFNVLRRPRGSVEVKAASGAQVLFDGRNLGRAPTNLTDVLPGNHWIRVEQPGETPQVKRLLVRSKATILVEFDGAGASKGDEDDAPVGVLGAIAKNELEASHIDQLRAAGKRAGAKYVMAGAIYRTDTAFNIYTALISVSDGAVGRAQEIAFDLDMLSAQIEVFNLVADLKKQVGSGLTAAVSESPFKLAPKLDLKPPRKRAVVAAKEAKVQTVAAAPPPIDMPKEPPMVAEGGRAPMASPAAKGDGAVVAPVASVTPKDEKKPNLVATVIPRDEAGDDGNSNWWIWVIAGVVAAGAAGAGSYLLISGSSSDEGTLRIKW